jgi:hypothetical protein
MPIRSRRQRRNAVASVGQVAEVCRNCVTSRPGGTFDARPRGMKCSRTVLWAAALTALAASGCSRGSRGSNPTTPTTPTMPSPSATSGTSGTSGTSRHMNEGSSPTNTSEPVYPGDAGVGTAPKPRMPLPPTDDDPDISSPGSPGTGTQPQL